MWSGPAEIEPSVAIILQIQCVSTSVIVDDEKIYIFAPHVQFQLGISPYQMMVGYLSSL